MYHEWFPAYQIWHNKWWDPFSVISYSGKQRPHGFYLFLEHQSMGHCSLIHRSIHGSANTYTIQRLSNPLDRICYKLTHKFAKSRTKEAITIFDAFAAEIFKEVDYLTKYT